MTITELINKLTDWKLECGDGYIVVIDSENNYFRNGFIFDLGNYNCEMGWEYLLKVNDNY